LIANHINSDRNNDGWDSVEIFNGFKHKGQSLFSEHDPEDEFVPKYFGFGFFETDLSEHPITGIVSHEVTRGVHSVGMWSGTTIKVIDKESSLGRNT